MSKRRTHKPQKFPSPQVRHGRRSVAAGRSRRSLQDHAVHPIQVKPMEEGQLLEGASELFAQGKKTQGQDEQPGQGKANCFPEDWQKLQMELEWLKKSHQLLPDARECEKLGRSRPDEKSRSAAVRALGLTQITLSYKPSLCLNPPWDHGQDRCAVFGGINLGSRGWLVFGPKGSRSAVTVSETSCGAGFYGRNSRSHAPRCQGDPSEALFPAWVASRRFTEVGSGFGQQIYYIPLRKGFL